VKFALTLGVGVEIDFVEFAFELGFLNNVDVSFEHEFLENGLEATANVSFEIDLVKEKRLESFVVPVFEVRLAGADRFDIGCEYVVSH
jgi:hypothetical protein